MKCWKLLLQFGGGKQWSVLHHNGPFFPEEYKPHHIPVIVNNKHIKLNKLVINNIQTTV